MSSQLSVDVDGGDLLARHHDVVHRDAPEIQDRQQHLAVARRDDRRRLRDHGAQLLGAQGLIAAAAAPHAKNAQEAVSEDIGQPQRRAGDQHQSPVDARGVQRHPFRVGGRIDLGRELAEDDDDDGERHARERHGVTLARALREDRDDGGGEHARARQDHQIRPQPLIGLLEQPLEGTCAPVARLRAVPHAIAVDREHCHFGARGEGDDEQQQHQGEDQHQRVR